MTWYGVCKDVKYLLPLERNFPGGPIAKTVHSQCRGPRFDLGVRSHMLQLRPGRVGRNINNPTYADDTTPRAESEEELKSLLMKVKEESKKSWLKTQHPKNEDHGTWSHHFVANRWGNNRNSDRLYFLGFQNHCRWCLQP